MTSSGDAARDVRGDHTRQAMLLRSLMDVRVERRTGNAEMLEQCVVLRLGCDTVEFIRQFRAMRPRSPKGGRGSRSEHRSLRVTRRFVAILRFAARSRRAGNA